MDFATTGHGWSLFLTERIWSRKKRDVLFFHADIFFSPKILDKVIMSDYDNILSVDEDYEILTKDEMLVAGRDGIVESISKQLKSSLHIVGESISINRFSSEIMGKFYTYIERFCDKQGKAYGWEFILDHFIKDEAVKIHYIKLNVHTSQFHPLPIVPIMRVFK